MSIVHRPEKHILSPCFFDFSTPDGTDMNPWVSKPEILEYLVGGPDQGAYLRRYGMMAPSLYRRAA